jgi:light-harvesting protein B-800-850 alpha chain
MNQGRIWCVVNPTVGLPLFLGSVALMSFTVHFAVLNNSSWMKDFYNGVPLKAATAETAVEPVAKVATAVEPKMVFENVQPAASTVLIDAKTGADLQLPGLSLKLRAPG